MQLQPAWTGPLLPFAAPVYVAERSGCDVLPLDLTSLEALICLRSYVWADQPERPARIKGAIELAVEERVVVTQADAAAWVVEIVQAGARALYGPVSLHHVAVHAGRNPSRLVCHDRTRECSIDARTV